MSKRGKLIRKQAYSDVYQNKGRDYDDSLNPFPLATSDHALYQRCYEKVHNMFWRMESICQEMFEVYGGPYVE